MADTNSISSSTEKLRIKEEIAGKYIEKFKKELGWLKSLAILPIEKKLKDIMVSGKDLEGKKFEDLDDLGFWKDILGFLTPNMSIEIFNFLKEKQEAIVRAETSDKLNDLMTEVITGVKPTNQESPSGPQSSGGENYSPSTTSNTDDSSVETHNTTNEDVTQDNNDALILSTSATGYLGLSIGADKINKISILKKNPSLKEIQKSYDTIIQGLEDKLKNPKLLPGQKQNIKNSIKQFESARASTTNLKSVLADLDILSKKGIISVDELGLLDFGKSEIKILKNLDNSVLKTLASLKDEKEIASLLSKNGLDNVSREFIQIIKRADTLKDVTSVVKVASSVKTMSKVARVLKAVPFLDVIGAGFDVFTYLDESRQADLIKQTNQLRGENKQSQAYLHLATGMADAAMGLIALGVATPPVGRIAAGVAAAGVAVNQVMDTYYFDVVDFYTQNKEDYKHQYRTELKNAIYQATIHGESSINNSFADKFADTFNFSESIKQGETISLKDAYWAMIYQEEIEAGDYNHVLNINPEFPKEAKPENLPSDSGDLQLYKTQRSELLKKIEDRMKYISQFLPENNKYISNSKYDEFISNIKSANGINYIEKILGESKLYAEMINTSDPSLQGIDNLDGYKEKIKNKLISLNSKLFKNLEAIYNNDKYKFLELYISSHAFYQGVLDIPDTKVQDHITSGSYTSGEYDIMKKNAEYLEEYYKYKVTGESLETQIDVGYISNDVNYVNTKEFLLHIEDSTYIKPINIDQQGVKTLFQSNDFEVARLENNIEVSDSVGQNIIYEIAKQIHGYSGHNNQLDLINFFKEEKGDTLGIYYDDGWYLNLNNELDLVAFKLSDFDKKSAESMIQKLFTYVNDAGQRVNRENILNTTTDNGDDWLNQSYIRDVSNIIKSEKLYASPDHKKQIQTEIVDFIKANSIDGGYIQLPYNIIRRGVKSHIGDLRKYLFKYEDGNIVAITRGDLLHSSLDFGDYNISYESIGKTREQFTESELLLIQQVEEAHDKLEQLRSIEELSILGGTKEDDLDIPQELERMISQQRLQRQDIKDSLLYSSAYSAEVKLKSAHAQYYNYFDGLYTGLLTIVNNSKISNDADNIEYYNQALALANNNAISIDSDNNFKLQEGILNKNQDTAFKQLLKDFKIPGDNIKLAELVKSDNEHDQQKAIYYANKILKSILEAETLSFNENGDVSDIKGPANEFAKKTGGIFFFGGLGYLVSSGVYTKQKAKLLDNRLKINLSSPYVDTLKLKEELNIKLDTEDPSIRKVSNKESQIHQKLESTIANIIQTKDNIDRGGRRGNIEFNIIQDMSDDSVKGKIDSRDSSIDIEVNSDGYVKIPVLSIRTKNVESAIRIANFINWIRGYYLSKNTDKKGRFHFSYFGNLEAGDGYLSDTTVLDSSTLKKHFPELIDNDKFIEYINNIT